MVEFKLVGRLWNNNSIVIIEQNGRKYALNGYNGEEYLDCWEVADNKGFDKIGDKVYCIKPIYAKVEENEAEEYEFDIVDYEVR